MYIKCTALKYTELYTLYSSVDFSFNFYSCETTNERARPSSQKVLLQFLLIIPQEKNIFLSSPPYIHLVCSGTSNNEIIEYVFFCMRFMLIITMFLRSINVVGFTLSHCFTLCR